VKAIVTATPEQLEFFGISRNIQNMEVTWIKDYPDGYSEIEVLPEQEIIEMYKSYNKEPRMEKYDLPKRYLNFE